MTNDTLKCGTFFFRFGILSRRHFELTPVWCEYDEPSELDDVGVSDEWIQTNLFERLNSTDERVYYSTSKDIDYSKREFLNVSCELMLDGHKLQGYLYVVQGKVSSVSIFIDDIVVDLYSSDLLSEDNLETLTNISEHLKVNIENVDSIEYLQKNCTVNSIDLKGIFQFPVE
ncbi:hypothetical protein JF50_18035 [Pseudoalteromonas luteoviolacea]|uniref:Uncharacterized protein n=1 Tax=Pseudoalteromonas luteoviolacea TaxID=43657 RepID=A0A0C1MNS3_9GAMM|nr:hypothetical protein [Pseudoalteromonas luteoviolacea]KID56178.1 hypothetical protein JF50_18035 [Pseudoalteromonas luteoviolacea]